MATLKAEKREGTGKYVSFNLRKEGRLPGVIYGKSLKENVNVSVVLKEFMQLLKANERIIDLDVDGKPMHVLLKAVQHGTYDHEILHADFRAISDNDELEIVLEIELHGEAPGVKIGGMLEQNLHQVTARCLPKNMPEKIMLDVSNMNMGDILYIADLPKLDGVKYMAHGNPAVVSCHAPRGEEALAEGEAATTPEVIGEKEREAKD
ncbi:MAG: 50S ribosomal protein L25 [Planctomycetaceae bacterium]|nr:50S ribosomal protein L25 [Planctomycetaceae bacterium]